MIETRDNRQFFTDEENYGQLIEFSKTFDAEMSVVRVKEAEVLGLRQLVPAICNREYKIKKPDFEILETKISTKKRNRGKLLNNAKKIKKHIRDSFLSGDEVSLKDICKKFQRQDLTLACFCNHLSAVRKEMEKDGHSIEKIGGGKYQLKSAKNLST
jgi:hypothetical protein